MKLTLRRIEALDCPAGKARPCVRRRAERLGGSRDRERWQELSGAVHASRPGQASHPARLRFGDLPGTRPGRRPQFSAKWRAARIPRLSERRAATEAERKAAEEAFTLDTLLTKWAASHLTGRRASVRARGCPRAALRLQGPTGEARRRTQGQGRGARWKGLQRDWQARHGREHDELWPRRVRLGDRPPISCRQSLCQPFVWPRRGARARAERPRIARHLGGDRRPLAPTTPSCGH